MFTYFLLPAFISIHVCGLADMFPWACSVFRHGYLVSLRAKLLYDPIHLCVPVVEDGKDSPWNKLAFAEICDAIQHASV